MAGDNIQEHTDYNPPQLAYVSFLGLYSILE